MSDNDTLHPLRKPPLIHPAAIAAALLSLVLYLVTQARGPESGTNIVILNFLSGLSPLPPISHLPYTYAAQFFATVIPGSLFSNLNLLSALCGAGCILLFFSLLLNLPYFSSADDRRRHRSLEQRAALIGAIGGTLALALAPTFWKGATQAGNYTFDLLLLLGSFFLAVLGLRFREARWPLYTGALLFGIGVTEYASMFALAPIYTVLILFILLRRGELSAGFLLTILGCGLAGTLLYLLPLLKVNASNEYSYGQFKGALDVLVQAWKSQYREVRSGVPRVGSILIFLTCFGPWGILAAMVHPKRSKTIWIRISSFVSILLLVGLGTFIMMERHISPSRFSTLLLILPYLSTAAWMGYLAGFWYLYGQGSHAMHRTGTGDRIVGFSLLGLVLASAPVTAALRYADHHAPHRSEISRFTDNIVASLGDEQFLMMDGTVLDPLVSYQAWQAGKQKEMLSVRMLGQEFFRRYLAQTYPDVDFEPYRPESISSFLKAVIGPEGEHLDAVAFGRPEMLYALGYQAVPAGLVYHAARDFSAIDPATLVERNKTLFDGPFKEHLKRLKHAVEADWFVDTMRLEYSKTANNVAALLLILKKPDEALPFFERALDFFPDNPSVYLNLREHYLAQARDDQDGGFEEKAEEALEKARAASEKLQTANLNPASFSMRFGLVCSEHMMLWTTKQFQRTGNLESGATALEQAKALAPESKAVQLRSAAQSLISGDLDQAIEEYKALLKKEPGNIPALLAYATTFYTRSEPARALDILEDYQGTSGLVEAFRALLLAETDQGESARKKLEVLAASNPQEAQTLSYMALAYFALGEDELARHYAETALKGSPQLTTLVGILIRIGIKNQDHRYVLENYIRLAEIDPGNIPVLEQVISYSMGLNMESRARSYAEHLILMDQRNFLANFVLAQIALEYRQYDQMERYLRNCVIHTKDDRYDYAANHLAFALLQLGKFQEALPYAEESVLMNPSNDEFQHTLAEILLHLGKLETAQKALSVALTKAPNSTKHKMLQAELLAEQGQLEKAQALAREVLADPDPQFRKRAKRIISSGS